MFDAQRLVQIGVCVKDLDEAMEYYKKNFGMGPFAIMDSDVEAANYYGRKRPQHNRLALCKLGPVVFELIECLSGERQPCGRGIGRSDCPHQFCHPFRRGYGRDGCDRRRGNRRRQSIRRRWQGIGSHHRSLDHV